MKPSFCLHTTHPTTNIKPPYQHQAASLLSSLTLSCLSLYPYPKEIKKDVVWLLRKYLRKIFRECSRILAFISLDKKCYNYILFILNA